MNYIPPYSGWKGTECTEQGLWHCQPQQLYKLHRAASIPISLIFQQDVGNFHDFDVMQLEDYSNNN